MFSFNSLLLFSEDPDALAEFYSQVFDKEADWNEDDWYGFQLGAGMISIGSHSKVKGKNPNGARIMFNLTTSDVETEFARIKELGAEVIAEPYEMGEKIKMQVATFADPDGNYFQLMSPQEDYSVN